MQLGGAKDSQNRDSSNQKVHPQPMEEAANQNPEAVEALVSKIFTNISSLKSAYIHLQAAHTPYDPEKIQAADKLVISELKKLSELKHFYRENNPRPTYISPQDSRLAAEIQEQQSLLKTYEVMYLALREMDPLDSVGQNPDSDFGKFCRSKYILVVHPKMEASFFGNLDHRNYIMGGGHPRTPFYLAFLKLAKAIWLLHRLAHSFDPEIKVFQVSKGSEFSEVYMDSVVKNFVVDDNSEKPKVGLMVMPGFGIGGSVIQCRVYLTGIKEIE
ncbi:putative protein gravitropic in the light 1 [Helianthus annuus]|nr:putative protein gravitropic in the light 1 [Helianthus annuus]